MSLAFPVLSMFLALRSPPEQVVDGQQIAGPWSTHSAVAMNQPLIPGAAAGRSLL